MTGRSTALLLGLWSIQGVLISESVLDEIMGKAAGISSDQTTKLIRVDVALFSSSFPIEISILSEKQTSEPIKGIPGS